MEQPNLPGVGRCPKHDQPWVDGTHGGRKRCSFYVPELGAGEDYGCPQDEQSDENGVQVT